MKRPARPRTPTFHLLHHVVEVVLQLGVGGDEEREPVLLDTGEGLGRVDAPLVEDAVDPIDCNTSERQGMHA